MNLTDNQKAIFKLLKEELCETVEAVPVNKGAIKILTPFIDWKGSLVSIYVTEDGKITDGGNTINQLRSLKVIDNFEEWPFQEDFFHRYQIQRSRNSLEPTNNESGDALLAYVQGISRIPSFFEPKPIYSSSDNYPIIARTLAKDGLIEKYGISPSDISEYIKPQRIDLKSGRNIQNDMSPKNRKNFIKIISHSSSSSSDKRQHVDYNVLAYFLLKREESRIQFYAVIGNLKDYPKDSRDFLESEAKEIIETDDLESKFSLAKILVER